MENLKNAIETISKKIETGVTAPEAMNYSQAILNLAHALQVLKHTPK